MFVKSAPLNKIQLVIIGVLNLSILGGMKSANWETKYQKSCLLTNRSDKQFSMCTLPVFPLENILHLANKLESPLQLFLSTHLDQAEMINMMFRFIYSTTINLKHK